MYMAELKAVQVIFYEAMHSPPVYTNMPPTAGALTWAKGLIRRIDEPMDKIRKVRGRPPTPQPTDVEAICSPGNPLVVNGPHTHVPRFLCLWQFLRVWAHTSSPFLLNPWPFLSPFPC